MTARGREIITNAYLNFWTERVHTNYFLRFARVITSFSCTWFLRKLAPTLYTNIYWVQANIMSIGKSGAWVQLPVITLAKSRKFEYALIKVQPNLIDLRFLPSAKQGRPTYTSNWQRVVCGGRLWNV